MSFKSRLAAAISAFALCAPAAWAGNGVSVKPLSTGFFETNYKYMVDGGAAKDIRIPIPVYVVRHPTGGIVLFDSGLGADFRRQVDGSWFYRVLDRLLPSDFQESDAAVNQLRRQGVAPEQVAYVVVSHLHYDHAGGLRDFPRAKVVVDRKEWGHATSDASRWRTRLKSVIPEQLEGVAGRLRLVEYAAESAVPPFAGSHDLFGDGSVVVLSTPGHTPGHQSLLVTSESGQRVLLTGDAVWVREGYQRPARKSFWIRHLEEENDAAWQTTQAIHAFSTENADVLIVPGHDPDVWSELPEEIR